VAAWLDALAAVLEPTTFLYMAGGTVAGLVGAAIPGVTITMTVILVLPFTFGVTPLQGLSTMIGVYVGGSTGGLITATLLGIPGTPSAIATTFEGFPMTRKGEPGRALWLGIWASFIGGLLATPFLVVGATQLAALAIRFGPWEFFSLFVLTLTIVASLSEESLLKGLMAGVFGLFVTAVGADPLMGVARFTFDTDFLLAGFPFLPVLIGVFAFSQMMKDLETLEGRALGNEARRRFDLRVNHFKVIAEIFRQPFNLAWSSMVGLWIGILPAVGGSAANILAYDQAKKFSRHPEKFGTGIPDGIIAAEASNDANVGGSLITMMAFGIPGDAVTAVMLGALIIHGIAPGPLFVITHQAVAYGMFAAYILTHFVTVAASWVLLRYCLRVILTPLPVLVPVILVLCAIGSYALNNIIENVWTLFFFGIIGYLMVKFGFPLAPLILGVVLGDQLEANYIRAVMTDADPWQFVARPISGILLGLSVASVVVSLWQRRRRAPAPSEAEPDM
jgi:putative tricarboxylic transport membrane protein